MKKTLLSLGLTMAAILTLTNCSKENVAQESAGTSFEFIANTPDTKTTLDGLTTKWAENDAINVVYAAAGETSNFMNCGQFTVSDAEAGTFTGSMSNVPTEGTSYDWYAIYPYKSKFTSPDNASTCYFTVGTYSQTQEGNNSMTHVSGSNVPMYGYASAQTYTGSAPSVSMKHLATLFKVHVTNGSAKDLTVSTITLTSETEQIAGTFYISFVGGNVSYASSGTDNYTKKYITLMVNNGEAIAAGASADFYMAACPFTVAQGGKLTIDIKAADDATCSKTYTASSEIAFTAGKMKTLNVTYVPESTITYSTVKEVLDGCASLSSGSTSEDTYNVKDAVVMAKSGTNNFILSDGTANILYYGASATTAVGDVVKVTGKVKNYYGTLEFASDQTIETTGTTTPSYPTTATTVDETYITSYASNVKYDYVTVTGTVDNSGYIVVGAKKVRVYNINDTDFSSFKGKYVDATGYAYGYHSSGYMQLIASSMVESQSDYLTLDPASLSWTAAETAAKTVTVSCNSTWSVDASTVPAWITVGTEGSTITLTPSANTGDAREATITVKHTNGTTTATIAVSQEAKTSATGNVDTITAASLAATNTTYTDFSGKTFSSNAVYAGNSAKNGDNIQLRSKNSNSGIVSTVSGGKVKSITITVASGSNTIDVYGNNTAYTAASNLYATGNSSNQGTKLGSLTSTGTITVSGDYQFVGIRSNNGTVYIASVEITWE